MTAYDSIPLIRKKVNPNIRVRWCGGLFRSQAFSSHNCHVQVCSIFVIEQFQLKTKECSVIFKKYGWEKPSRKMQTWVGLHRLSPRKVLSFPFSPYFCFIFQMSKNVSRAYLLHILQDSGCFSSFPQKRNLCGKLARGPWRPWSPCACSTFDRCVALDTVFLTRIHTKQK